MFKSFIKKITCFIFMIGIIFCASSIFNNSYSAQSDGNYHVKILNDVSDDFKNKSKAWAETLKVYALRLFWLLASISLAWTAIELALKHAEFGEIIGELAKYIIFTGLFAFLLEQGPTLANVIFETFAKIGGIGSGLPSGGGDLPTMNPSEIVDVGLDFYSKVASSLEWGLSTIVTDLVQSIIAIIFFIFCLIIAIKVLVQLISLWCYMYAGAILLGFGGSRWHRDIAVNYFKGVLSASVKYFAMLFIIGIMKILMASLITGSIFKPIETLQALALPIIFYMIMETVPDMIAGIVNGKFDFHSGPAASAVAGAMAVGVAASATTAVIAGKGATATAQGASKAIDYMSNHSVSEGMKDLGNSISNSSAGKAAKGVGKMAAQVGKAGLNVSKGMSKGMSATSGFLAEGVKHPKATLKKEAKSAATASVNAVKDLAQSGGDALKKAGQAAKNAMNDNVVKPFQAGANAAKTNNSNGSGNSSNSNNSGNSNNSQNSNSK